MALVDFFFIWGYIIINSVLVYGAPVNVEEKLVARILLAFSNICGSSQLFRRIPYSIVNHYNLCIGNGGRNLAQFL